MNNHKTAEQVQATQNLRKSGAAGKHGDRRLKEAEDQSHQEGPLHEGVGMSKIEKFFLSVDWALLSTQKVTLVEYISQRAEYLEDQADTDPALADLDGILNFLDAIQDFAADEFGVTTHFPSEQFSMLGHCVVCHRPVFDQHGLVVDDTGGDICEDNQPHCLGFKAEADDVPYCANCGAHEEDHPDVA